MTNHNLDNIFSGHSFIDPWLSFQNEIENNINDLFWNEEDDRRYFYPNENISQDTNIKPFMNTNYNFEDRTRDKTDKRLKNLIENKNGNAPHYFSLNTISGILVQNDGYNNRLIDKIIKDEKLLESDQYAIQYMNSIKSKSSNYSLYQNDNIPKEENFIGEELKKDNNHLQKKRGRSTNKSGGKVHTRYHADNIIKKIKAEIFNNCLIFINKMIKNNDEESTKLLKINYNKYIDQLERKKNLDLFEMTLADLFSLDISDKYISKSKDYNKDLINRILKQEIEVEDFYTIKFLFKITLNDWIELFTYKKDILTLIDENNAANVNYTKIQENFIGVNHLLNKISEKNDDKYYTLFLLYIFNFQRWFYIKRGRVLKKKEE